MAARPPDQRQTPRIQPFVAPCRLVAGARRIPGYLSDLSPRGARVSCDEEPPPVGAAVVLEVRFGREVLYSRLPAEVEWVQAGIEPSSAPDLGLSFKDISPDDQKVLEAVVQEFRRRAEQLVTRPEGEGG